MSRVSLYQNGYRCVVRGTGLYLDYANYRNPAFIQKLVDNEVEDATKKKLVANSLMAMMRRDAQTHDYGQYKMDFDENNESLRIVQELTDEQLIDMLKDLIRREA